MKNVTIKDIAKVANVSYATVSRALSGSREIGEDTRARILKLCSEMGYTTNYIARSMVVKRTELIGLIVGSIDNPFMSELAYYVELHARSHGYNLMLCNSSNDIELETKLFGLLMGRQVDGIIIAPSCAETYSRIKDFTEKVPTVFMSENLKDVSESYVAIDNFKGTFIGTEYIHSLGHNDILYFGRRKGSTTHQLRAEGYIAACEKHGLKPRILNSPYTSSSIQYGYQMAKQLLAKPMPCTAIFASTDSNALGILKAADEAGVRIPEDLSLLGFDNIRYAELPKINLTTIEQPKAAIAEVAVDILLDKINNASSGYSHRILTPTLVERGSCMAITND